MWGGEYLVSAPNGAKKTRLPTPLVTQSMPLARALLLLLLLLLKLCWCWCLCLRFGFGFGYLYLAWVLASIYL